MDCNIKENKNATCIQKWTAGPDWFRTKVVGPRQVKAAVDAIRDLQSEDINNGHSYKPWSFQGWKGFSTGSVRWGLRDWSLIWESSGEITPFTLTRLQPFIGSGKRIDLQVTLQFSSPQLRYVEQCLKPRIRTTRRQTLNSRLLGLSRRTDGYACGTVGRRTHPRYWRLYDKGVESKELPAGHSWRLELETKGTLAEDLCKLGTDTLTSPQFCANYCVSSWKQEGFSWPPTAFADDVSILELRRRPPSPAAHLLMWAYRTVTPAAQRLLTVFTVAEVLHAFGLTDVATSRRKNDA